MIAQRDFTLVVSLCTILGAFYNNEDNNLQMGGGDNAPEGHWAYVEKWFAYSLVWSLGATADEEGERELMRMRDIESNYPPQGNVYDYCRCEEKISVVGKTRYLQLSSSKRCRIFPKFYIGYS